MTTVVVADASPFVRLGLATALRDGGLDVSAECATPEAAELAVLQHRPKALLLDAELDPGLDVATRLHAELPKLACVLLCPDSGDSVVLAAVRAGARGVLSKETPLERLPTIVRGAIAGEAVLTRAQAGALIAQVGRSPGARLAREGRCLSRRERQVLEFMSSGLTDAAIAAQLQLSPVTVRRHASTARHKLRAARREDALERFRDAVS